MNEIGGMSNTFCLTYHPSGVIYTKREYFVLYISALNTMMVTNAYVIVYDYNHLKSCQ